MDLYTEICFEKLGIPASSTLIEIEQAYKNKMTELHPAFFSNDGINNISEQAILLRHFYRYLSHNYESFHYACHEVEIFNKKHGMLRYSLSNDFIKILNAYIRQTGGSVCFTNEIKWRINKKLPDSTKCLMNNYNADYAVTYYMKEGYRIIRFFKRSNNKWYSMSYCVKPSQSERLHAAFSYYEGRKTITYYFWYCIGFAKGFVQRIFFKRKRLSYIQRDEK